MREILRCAPAWWHALADQPRLKRREEEGGGNSAEDAAQHQHPVVLGVLGDAAQDVQNAIELTCTFAPHLVGHRAHECSEDHAGTKASYKEHGNVMLGEAVRRVERVHVRTLQPIGCHGNVVDAEVGELEELETGR